LSFSDFIYQICTFYKLHKCHGIKVSFITIINEKILISKKRVGIAKKLLEQDEDTGSEIYYIYFDCNYVILHYPYTTAVKIGILNVIEFITSTVGPRLSESLIIRIA